MKQVLRKVATKKTLKVLLASIALAGIVMGGLFWSWTRELPNVQEIREKIKEGLSQVTRVYDCQGRLISQLFVERRVWTPLEDVPIGLRQAFIATEDNRFYKHGAIDLKGILRAAWTDFRALKIVQGGSTITQQVAKLLFLTPDRSVKRKVKEVLLALRLEKILSKDDILELYLNLIYFGHGAYGVEVASQAFFGKDLRELGLVEYAALAAIPKAPATYSLFNHPDKNKARREYVLKHMLKEGYITYQQYLQASHEDVHLAEKKPRIQDKAPYFTEYVRQYLVKTYGSEDVYHKGLRVYTTLDLDWQLAAQKALKEGLRSLDKRENPYRGAVKHLNKGEKPPKLPDELNTGEIYQGVVKEVTPKEVKAFLGARKGVIHYKDMAWAFKGELESKAPPDILSPMDLILVRILGKDNRGELRLSLEQDPVADGALISLDMTTGEIKAMVGGYDFERSQFNRVIQALRQPGSAFKPIVDMAAIDTAFTPASIILDAPITYNMHSSEEAAISKLWKPENYTERFYGPTTLRVALAHSRNVVTVKLMRKLGVGKAIKYARKVGISTPLRADLSLALGTSEVSLYELTRAYAVFPTLGMLMDPVFITSVIDREGNILEEKEGSFTRVISQATAYIMTSMLESVVQEGTGQQAKELGIPCGGKTGTTNDYRSAWFIGFTPKIITGVYVGNDDHSTLGKGETGAKAALPVWLNFMKEVTINDHPEPFPIPPTVVFARIDPKTGLLAYPDTPGAFYEVFRQGTEPNSFTSKEEGREELLNQELEGLQPAQQVR
jgi:penicillin-binding protein 1A